MTTDYQCVYCLRMCDINTPHNCSQKIFLTKDSGERKEYSTGMQRDTDKGKARFDLCYKPMLWRWAELMARGAEKYGANNWQKASTQEELDRCKASAERHLQQYLRGDTDEDHVAAVFFNLSACEFIKEKLNTTELHDCGSNCGTCL